MAQCTWLALFTISIALLQCSSSSLEEDTYSSLDTDSTNNQHDAVLHGAEHGGTTRHLAGISPKKAAPAKRISRTRGHASSTFTPSSLHQIQVLPAGVGAGGGEGEGEGQARGNASTGIGNEWEQISYKGGAVMSDANVMLIFYGSWTSPQSKSTMAILQNFVANLNGSPWYNVNRYYTTQNTPFDARAPAAPVKTSPPSPKPRKK
jgi:hypothetical protein